MAEKKTTVTDEIEQNLEEKTEKIFIPFSGAPDEPETQFFGVNGKTYYVRKGEWVDVPLSVADVWRNIEREKKKLRDKARAAGR